MKIFLKALAGIIVVGCSSLSLDDANRGWKLMKPLEVKLDNGLRILFLEDHTLPRVSLNMMVMSGSLHDPVNQPGLHYMTAALIEKGAGAYTATQFADEIGQLASELVIDPSLDYTNIEASTLSSEREKLLKLFSMAILNPSFSESELQREKTKIIAQLKHLIDEPSHFAELNAEKIMFGAHPYANPPFGTEASIRSMNRNDVVKNFFKDYRPNNSLLAVTGDFGPEFQNQVQKAFTAWQFKEVQTALFSKPIQNSKEKIFLFSKSGLEQAQIRIVDFGIRRSDPDYLKLKLANAILGGEFVSRLNFKIRDELGLTYSIQSGFEARLDEGLFQIATFTRNDKVGETIAQSLKVVSDFVQEGVTSSELQSAKTLLIGQFPAAMETQEKLAISLQLLRRYKIPDDYLENFNANLQKISVRDVNEAVRRHIHPDQLKVVVYADQELVQSQLEKIGVVSLRKNELVSSP